MKRLVFRRFCSFIIFVMMVFPVLCMIPAAAQQTDREVLSEIDAYLRGEMEKAGIPGAALGIIKDGEVFYLKGYGLAGDQVTAVTAQTSFAVGSVSKSFAAVAVLQLHQSGELTLDAPVTEYLPWLKVGGGVPAGDITIRHLLNQTGGITALSGEAVYPDDASAEDVLRLPGSVSTDAALFNTFTYSNMNYTILGAVVEAVSGRPYNEYVDEQILRPLGMDNSLPSRADVPADKAVRGFQSLFGLTVASAAHGRAYQAPSGGMVSTAEDMTRYAKAILGGVSGTEEPVLDAQSFALLAQPAVPVSGGRFYSMGWYVGQDGSYLMHGGSTEDFQASLRLFPEQKLGVVLLMNKSDIAFETLMGVQNNIASGIISVLYGYEPPKTDFWSTNMRYIVIDTALLLLMALWLLTLWQTMKSRKAGNRATPLRLVPVLAAHTLIPLFVLWPLPTLLGENWKVLIAYCPDLSISAIILSVLFFTVGILRFVFFLRLQRASAGQTDI